MNRFDFVHAEIERAADAKLTLFERYKKERQAELSALAAQADLQMDKRRGRKAHSQSLSLD